MHSSESRPTILKLYISIQNTFEDNTFRNNQHHKSYHFNQQHTSYLESRNQKVKIAILHCIQCFLRMRQKVPKLSLFVT